MSEDAAREAVAPLVAKLRVYQGKLAKTEPSMWFVAKALGGIGHDALPALLKALGEPNDELRYWAIDALAHMGPRAKEALPVIRKATDDPNRRVAARARYALAQVEGKK